MASSRSPGRARLGPQLARLLPWRRRAHPLGEGLWRADFDRVDRAAGRVLQVVGLRASPAGEAAAVEEVVGLVRAARERAWQCCVAAHERAPGTATEVPADDALAAAHRALSRTATATAQVAQAFVIGGGDVTAARRAAESSLRRAEQAATAMELPP